MAPTKQRCPAGFLDGNVASFFPTKWFIESYGLGPPYNDDGDDEDEDDDDDDDDTATNNKILTTVNYGHFGYPVGFFSGVDKYTKRSPFSPTF